MSRNHFLFLWPGGCPFAVMTEEAAVTETNAWYEAMETAARIEAAQDAGVRLIRISHDEWATEWQAKFKADCGHGKPTLPARPSDEPDLEQAAIDHAVKLQLDAYWEELDKQLDNEGSALWARLGSIVDGLRPDLAPYDRREVVGQIAAVLKEATDAHV